MPFFAKATLDLPYADGADDERRQLEDKHSRLIYVALRKLMRLVAPADTTVRNITPDIAVQRYQDNRGLLRDAIVAMLTDGAMLGADVGKAQTEAAMGVGDRKATPTITGVDWDLINDDVLQWVMGGGLGGSSFGQGYADTLATAMAGTSERGLRTLVGEWVRNDLSYRQLVTDLERSLFSRLRAEMVASTEITKAYAEGNRAAWVRGGIIAQMQWFTAGSERTCPICLPMNGQIADVRGSFGSGLFPPAHPRCRCFLQPYVGSTSTQSSTSNAIESMTLDQLLDIQSESFDQYRATRHQLRDAEDRGDVASAQRFQLELDRIKQEGAVLNERVRLLQEQKQRQEDEALRLRSVTLEPGSAEDARLRMIKLEAEQIERQKEIDKLVDRYEYLSAGIRVETGRGNLTAVEQLADERDLLGQQIAEIKRANRVDYLQLVYVKTPANTAYTNTGNLSYNWTNGLDEFNKLVSSAVFVDKKVRVEEISGRAYATTARWSIHLDRNEQVKVIVHELGHLLESDLQIKQKVFDFYDRRTAGDKLEKLSDVNPDRVYSADEVTRRDRWIDAYIGKDYGRSYTEILSMGLEFMYSDPLQFAKRDPEMFDFVFNTVRGR